MYHKFCHLSQHYALVTLYLQVFNNKANILSKSADRNRRSVTFAAVWQLFLFTFKSTSGTYRMENVLLDTSTFTGGSYDSSRFANKYCNI